MEALIPGEKLNQPNFFDTLGFCPERKLLAAFLMRNFNDACGRISWGAKGLTRNHEPAVNVVASARRWFYSKDTGPYTFLNVCDLLEISPEHILDLLKKTKLQGLNIYWQMELI